MRFDRSILPFVAFAGGRTLAPLLLAIGVGLVVGCASGWPTREGIIRPDGIHVVHVPGIVGAIPHDQDFAYGLLLSGAQDVEAFEWTHPFPLVNLTSSEHQEQKAAALRERLITIHEENPEARVVITAHSGGCRIALRAIEGTAEDGIRIEQLWLLAPALSPDYDFGPALERVPRIVALSSEQDWIILGLGTSWFGSSDHYRGDAAGRVGFSYDHPRFEQWIYHPGWREFGYNGDHVRVLGHAFVEKTIGPSMMNWRPSPDIFEYNVFRTAQAEATGSPPASSQEDASSPDADVTMGFVEPK